MNQPKIAQEQVQFIENQIPWCLQGWQNAGPEMRERLIGRTIRVIVVTREELQITFWTGPSQELAAPGNDEFSVAQRKWDTQGIDPNNTLTFKPRKRKTPPAGTESGASDHHSSFHGSGKVKNGSEEWTQQHRSKLLLLSGLSGGLTSPS